MISNLFPSFLLSSATRSLPTVQVPSLAELQKQAELLASSIPPLPSFSSSPHPGKEAKGEISAPQQSRSKGLPIPSLNHAQSKSWYTHPHPPVYTEGHKEEGGEKEKEKGYIDEIDIGHGYDHIHRCGVNASSPSSTNRKLWKTWNGGFRPIRSQEVIPDENGRGVRAKKYGMEGSKSYAESLCNLTQPSIRNMRDDGKGDEENKSTWLEWITCKSCN